MAGAVKNGPEKTALFCCTALGLLLAQSGHRRRANPCPLLGVKRTSRGLASIPAHNSKADIGPSPPDVFHLMSHTEPGRASL
jgi:hypothetical protein